MARTLTDFLNIHRGETAWMFGKGPSLDSFDMSQAGPLRCAINDVVKEVPGCRYCFANDSVAAWEHVYEPGHVLFTPARTINDGFQRPVVPEKPETIVFADIHHDDRLSWSREMLAEHGLTIRRGTLGSALQILHIMGIAEIICVGIDGGGKHAARQWHTRLRADHALDYNSIRESFITAARVLGIRIKFWGVSEADESFSNGLMLIKITDPVLISGKSYNVGELVEVLPSEAIAATDAGRAVYWKFATVADAPKTEAPAIETAEAAPATETAVAPHAKSKRRK